MQKHIVHHEKLKQFLTTYSIHIVVLLFLVNVGIYYTIRQYIHASGCMSMAEVQTDNRCLYVFNGQVYQKNNRASPHKGHPCGTDVTSVMPASHLANRALYLLPDYVANVCPAATSTPVPTVTPRPTLRTTATLTPRPTPTPTPRPTPTLTPKPPVVMLQHPTTPPATSIPPTSTPTTSTQLPTNTLAPTQSADPNSATVNLSFTIPGINHVGNQSPQHTTRNITISLYNPSDDPSNINTQPVFTAAGNVSFDGTDMFTNPNFSLGVIPAGDYQMYVKMQQFVKQQVKNIDGTNIFSLNPGQTTVAQVTPLISGDINPSPDGDDVVDTSDYNIVLSCFSNNTNSCMLADFNDDGIVDGSDYNIFLGSLHQYQLSHAVRTNPVSVTSAPIQSIISPTVIVSLPTSLIPTAVSTIAPTEQISPSITPTPASFIASITNMVFLTKLLDILVVLLFVGILIFGLVRSKLIRKIFKFSPVSPPVAIATTPPTLVKPIVSEEPIVNTFFVSVLQPDANGRGIWVQLTGDAGQIEGLCHARSVPQGFSQIKGIKKTENGKTYIDITEILPAA